MSLEALNARIMELRLDLAIQDGRLQVAMAVAAVSSKVTVDPKPTAFAPFSTSPEDLFDRKFDDPLVKLTALGMARFKKVLAISLPDIKKQILDDIPETPGIQIESVAELVRLALLVNRGGGL